MCNIGRKIYGYCNGYFGRDSYEDKRIEAEGHDWIVVRDSDGEVLFASFENNKEKESLINEWSEEK